MKRLIVLVLATACALAAPAFAQKAPPPAPSSVVDPARIAAAKDLLTVMGSTNQFKIAIETMTQGMSNLVKQKQPDKAKDIDEVFALMKQKFLARSSEVIDMVAPLWAEKFTVEELGQIGTFFKSPIGAKLIETQPEIMRNSMQMGMAWGQKIGKEVEDEARVELKKRGVDI